MIQLLGGVLLALQAWAAAPAIERSGDTYIARQPQHGLEARFGNAGTTFRHRQKQFAMVLQGHAASGAAAVEENHIALPHGDVTEWFINDDKGLEHGFTVARAIAKGPLALRIEVSGDYRPVMEAGEVVLLAADGSRLRYGGLKSWDATGRALATHAAVDGRLIRLEVDDAGAAYPVTVDPLFQESPIVASDPTSGSWFGYSVAADGDTVVVGAPYLPGQWGGITNTRPGIAYDAQIYFLQFVQTFGTPCTTLPVRRVPTRLPLSLGNLPVGGSAFANATFDFSACPANARFNVSAGYMSNGGASGGVLSLVNQFQ